MIPADVELVLFDIDGTIMNAAGAGSAAFRDAAESCFGGQSPELDLAGTTDLAILAHIATHFGVEMTPELLETFFARYHSALEKNLSSSHYPSHVLPAVEESIALFRSRGAHLGVLTGNSRPGASIKLRFSAVEHHFGFGAYGDEHAERNDLGPLALARAEAHAQRRFAPESVLIIGDTPRDIACARAIGARCVAVATGHFTKQQLQEHAPDYLIDTLDCLI